MRQIKFRAWDVKGKVMLDWVTLRQTAFNRSGEYGIMYKVLTSTDEVFIPMQYTGLKDKSGKEIYEGDIVKVDWHDPRYKTVTAVVEWVEDAGQWSFGPGATSEVKWSHEVIGNICETPELIQTEKLTS